MNEVEDFTSIDENTGNPDKQKTRYREHEAHDEAYKLAAWTSLHQSIIFLQLFSGMF